MKQRGRKSANSIANPKPVESIATKRPAPPQELGTEAAAVWHDVVSGYAADYFRKPERDLLANYCKHITEARRLSKLVETLPDENLKDLESGAMPVYLKLLKARDTEVRAAASLARAMRITHQSRVSRHNSNPMSEETDKPWN